jgi:sensor histidine kinase regulating citrate/malate metabolism
MIGRAAAVSLVLVAAQGLAGGARPAEAQGLSDAQREQAIAVAKAIAADATVVDEVRRQNARKVPLAEIQKIDKAWMAAKGVDDRMQTVMENACARTLKLAQTQHKEVAEAFVMDDQGANVCMTNKTSDYWQGDAPKFDESVQAYLVQVSVPVMAGVKAIGAVTVGINLERLASR